MSQLILSRGISNRRNFIIRFIQNFELSVYFLLVSLVVFVALITVVTLLFSTRQVTKGYVLDSLEVQHQGLTKESEVKDMQISSVRSLNYIEESSKVRRMVKPRGIVYIDADTALAKR